MNIWTSRQVLAVAALLGVAACSDGEIGGLFARDDARPDRGLAEASLARGAVTLRPPSGFCIDRRGLTSQFAIMARCDSLGNARPLAGAPLGMIAVSVAPFEGAAPADIAGALPREGSVVVSQWSEGAAVFFQMTGPTPPGTDAQHWRGLVPVGGHLVAVSAFGPPGGRMSGPDGGAMIASWAQDMTARGPQTATPGAQTDAAPGAAAPAGALALLRGIFK